MTISEYHERSLFEFYVNTNLHNQRNGDVPSFYVWQPVLLNTIKTKYCIFTKAKILPFENTETYIKNELYFTVKTVLKAILLNFFQKSISRTLTQNLITPKFGFVFLVTTKKAFYCMVDYITFNNKCFKTLMLQKKLFYNIEITDFFSSFSDHKFYNTEQHSITFLWNSVTF